MEDALARILRDDENTSFAVVLILVVMEDALAQGRIVWSSIAT